VKVLLVAEGEHEIGSQGSTGALKVLVQRLLEIDAEVECDILGSRDLHIGQGKGPDLAKRAAAWLREAQKRGKDALVLLIDCDDQIRRLKILRTAQEDRTIPLDRAFGVAVQAFDAWMLADEKAAGKALDLRISAQKNPETIKQPKASFRRLLSKSPMRKAQSEAYAEIAGSLDVEVLQKRCRKGFAPFAKNVRALTTPSASSGS